MSSDSTIKSGSLRASIQEHAELLSRMEGACLEVVVRLAETVVTRLARGGKVLFFGNGGSAADAQHLAAEFAVRFVRERRPLAGLALTTNTSALTACGNDYGFERLFSRQIEALGRPEDVAIGFSTSGDSPNIVTAIMQARQSGIFTAAFTGETGGKLRGLPDLLIAVPSQSTARIQEMHILLGHLLCQQVEQLLGIGE
jgi:D-sedoheptulose 7-phosphate isomerase